MSRAAAAVTICLAALCGCGGDGDEQRLTVSAAASLKSAFESYGREFESARVRYSFGGSDELAAQIRNGVRPDVFAAANTALPEQLHRRGLVERPVVFARNRLVVAVPARRSRIRSLADLADPAVRLVVGSPSVPIGMYTRLVIERLPLDQRQRVTDNIRSNEPDVAGISGKLAQGAGDAGFVYLTDVRAAGGRLRAIGLPARLRPDVLYAAAVPKDAERSDQARAFVRGLLDGEGAAALREAGFGSPPGR